MNKREIKNKSLHRSWLRWLPYTVCGALLISMRSGSDFHSILITYTFLMLAQVGIITLYLFGSKLKQKRRKKI